MFAIECWKPQKINAGTPKRIPRGDFVCLYISTAKNIITPQKNERKKNDINVISDQLFTFSAAISTSAGLAIEINKPKTKPYIRFITRTHIPFDKESLSWIYPHSPVNKWPSFI